MWDGDRTKFTGKSWRDLIGAVPGARISVGFGGANVAVATGKYDVVFERPEEVGGVRFAALSQVAVDLLTGPGRNPSEALALLDWMSDDESVWRR